MFRFLLPLGTSLGLLVACGSNTPPKDTAPAAGSLERDRFGRLLHRRHVSSAAVEVDNRAFEDMTIYVVYQSERIRLGDRDGKQRHAYLRDPAVHRGTGPVSLRFAADPIGGTHPILTEPITVEEGDMVSLLIPR